MSKTNMKTFFRNVQTSASKHSPEILIGFGVAGFITTTVLAIRATPKAMKLIEDEKNRQNYELCREARANGEPSCNQIEKLSPIEAIKVAWKPYIPAAVTGVVSIACVIGANSVNAKRNAALATAYQLSTAALSEYKDKVIETIGEKKEQSIREKISKDRVEHNPVNNSAVYVTGNGESLFLEPISKRYFKSDIERIRGVVNTLNENMYGDPFGQISLSDFYDEIGLERTDISNDLGWCIDSGSIKLEFHPVMSDDGKPCLALYYITAPKWGYDK